MLNVSRPMTPGHAKDYFKKDDYYLKEGGIWHGQGAESLGLHGEINKNEFHNVLMGLTPQGKPLIQKGINGEHRAGLDLTFAAPKSVSILSTTDHRLRERHDRAVSYTLNHIEKCYTQARQTINNRTFDVDTKNLVIARLNHMTSRELDPHMHTHCFIMNMTEREDKEWRALEIKNFYYYQMYFGQFYRNHLAKEIQSLGYAIEIKDRKKGLFEIEGVPQDLIDEFSTRRKQVEERAAELKKSGEYKYVTEARLYEIAVLQTRKSKDETITKKYLVESWMETLESKGYTLEQIKALADEKAAEKVKNSHQNNKLQAQCNNPYECVRKAAHAVTAKESVFERERVLDAANKYALSQFTGTEIVEAYEKLVKRKEIIELEKNQYTTKEMRKIEKQVLLMVEKGRGQSKGIDEEKMQEHLRIILKGSESHKLIYNRNQISAIQAITGSSDRFFLVQGDAGTGKTTMAKAVKRIFEKEGWQTLGFAFTGKAAGGLQKKADVLSSTIDKFLHTETGIKKGKSLWIIDETSMVGSRQIHKLFKLAEKHDAKAVIMGDKKQFPAILSGKPFSDLQEESRIAMVELKEQVRQEKGSVHDEAVRNIAKQKTDRAMEILKKSNNLIVIEDPEKMLNAIADMYIKEYRKDKDSMIITSLNKDREGLNNRIRDKLVEHGELTQGVMCDVLESANLDPTFAHFADCYEMGQTIILNGETESLPQGVKGEIESINQKDNTITISYRDNKTGQTKNGDINVHTDAEKLSLYKKAEKEFSKGDRIVFLKNRGSLGVNNGTQGTVLQIDSKGNTLIRTEENKEVRVNLKEKGKHGYNYITHAYAVTSIKSQGITSENIIWHAPTFESLRSNFYNPNSLNAFYIAMSRAKKDGIVFTDDLIALKEQVKDRIEKSSTFDFEKTDNFKKARRKKTSRINRIKSAHKKEKTKIIKEMVGNSVLFNRTGIVRTKWTEDTEKAVQHTTISRLKKHHYYEKAKEGDHLAAIQVANSLLNRKKILSLKKSLQNEKNILIVPVAGYGFNEISQGTAYVMSDITGWKVAEGDKGILQTNMGFDPDKIEVDRILQQPTLEGEVYKKSAYVIVGDTVNTGNSIANLKTHIETNGGKVKAIHVLAAERYATKLKISQETEKNLKASYGEILEPVLKYIYGGPVNPENLTEKEARNLIQQKFNLTKRLEKEAIPKKNSRFSMLIMNEEKKPVYKHFNQINNQKSNKLDFTFISPKGKTNERFKGAELEM